MTTIIINEKTKKGKLILDLIKEMGIGKILEEKSEEKLFNNETAKAIQEAQLGNTIVCEDFEDYLTKVKD